MRYETTGTTGIDFQESDGGMGVGDWELAVSSAEGTVAVTVALAVAVSGTWG